MKEKETVTIKIADNSGQGVVTITELNGSRMAVRAEDVSTILQCVLEFLGYDVDIKLNE